MIDYGDSYYISFAKARPGYKIHIADAVSGSVGLCGRRMLWDVVKLKDISLWKWRWLLCKKCDKVLVGMMLYVLKTPKIQRNEQRKEAYRQLRESIDGE